jgi:GxxExxY protein
MDINELTGIVIEIAIKIHTTVGPGCFEKVYEEILYYELQKKDLKVERQQLLPIEYESLLIKDAYKIDLLIENKLVLEIKSIEHVLPVHFKQVMTYLKLLNLKNGMLLNFKVNQMKEGIHRVFNNFGN